VAELPSGTVTFLFTDLESLGRDRPDTLRAEGAAMDTDTAVAHTLAHFDAFLASVHD